MKKLSIFIALLLVGCGGGGPIGTGAQPKAAYQSAPAQQSTPHSSARGHASGDYDSSAESAGEAPSERPGLGTVFGEHRRSEVVKRRFDRADDRPFTQLALHYNDAEGVRAHAQYRGAAIRPLFYRTPAGGLTIRVLDEYGRPLNGGQAGGRTFVVGRAGQRYTLQIENRTGGRYELVASVDGLDVIDGKPASLGKRGYIINPHTTLSVEGFRTSQYGVAAFRFGSVRDSYAARTSGDRNVGVMGFAFFAERGSRYTSDELYLRDSANPFPSAYAQPPGTAW
jgi:hypothetical protein